MDNNNNAPNSEETNNEWLNLSLSTSSEQDSQPNNQLQPTQPHIEPEPKRYKPTPFTFQQLPLEDLNPSFSSLLEYDLLESLQMHPPTQPYTSSPQSQPQPQTQSLQETFSQSPNPNMSSLQQLYNIHEQSLLPPFNFQAQEPNVQEQEPGPSRARPHRLLPVRRAANRVRSDTIDPPYQWATSRRATVQSYENLLSQNITSISGKVKCKGCEEQYEIEFNLRDKFNEVVGFIIEQRDNMFNRAPESWTKPVLPTCNRCGKENSLEPVFTKKRLINWLFLLLGQMIGCCKLEYLKYFCKHTKNHRTAAKDRLIYLTYLGICKQLTPNGPFDP